MRSVPAPRLRARAEWGSHLSVLLWSTAPTHRTAHQSKTDRCDPHSFQGGSEVPTLVHGPHRAMRHAVFAPPKTSPCLRIDSRPYAEHVGVNRQRITPRKCGDTCARYSSIANSAGRVPNSCASERNANAINHARSFWRRSTARPFLPATADRDSAPRRAPRFPSTRTCA